MITIFETGDIEYPDIEGIDKPVRYTMQNLLDVASRTGTINITDEHSQKVIGSMSNFIVEDGLLKADEPEGLELKGMGFSPVYEYDLVDMGDHYVPTNISMREIGYTKNPRSKIVYNSIEVPNGEGKMEDSQLRDALDNNKKLNEEIGVLKGQIKQLKKSNQDKDNEIKKIRESYSDVDSKIKEYDSLKDIESKYNSLISSKKDDLIHQIVGDDKAKAERLQKFDVEDLELQIELMNGEAKPKGVGGNDYQEDDGNDPVPGDDDGDISVEADEMIEFYKSEFGEDPQIN